MQNLSNLKSDDTGISGSLNLLTATRRRWKIVLLVFVLIFSATVFYTHQQKPIYQATATIELNSPTEMGDKSFSVLEAIAGLKSRALANKIVQRLNLGWQATLSSPQLEVIIEQYVAPNLISGAHIYLTGPTEFTISDSYGRFLAKGRSGVLLETDSIRLLLHIQNGQAGQSITVVRQPVEHHIETFLSSLVVVPLEENSHVLRISMHGEDPKRISETVNQLIDLYRSSVLQESSQDAATIDAQLIEAEKSLELAELKLRDYRKQNGLSDLAPRGELLIGQATKLEQEKTGLEWQLSQIRLATERLQKAIKDKADFVAPRIDGFPHLTAGNTTFCP